MTEVYLTKVQVMSFL